MTKRALPSLFIVATVVCTAFLPAEDQHRIMAGAAQKLYPGLAD